MDKDNMDYMQLRPWTPLFQYPHDDAAGIVVTRADYECFLPNAPLNRTAVEFGLRLMVADAGRSPLAFPDLCTPTPDPAFGDIARDVHAFSTDFFFDAQPGRETRQAQGRQQRGGAAHI